MARIINGILGGFSGKVGTVVGYASGNRYHMRAAPSVPKKFTSKELLNQQKFKTVNEALKSFRALLKVGFKNYYTATGGLRAAVSYTYKNALIQQEGSFIIEPTLLKISGGKLPQALNPKISAFTKDTLTITWENHGRTNLNDQLILLAYDAEKLQGMSLVYDGPLRKVAQLKLTLPLDLQHTLLHVYIGFIAADRSQQSDSQYLGSINTFTG
ncbi:DUF6266 family protein [Pedobacter sp. UBA4863]|uniref:DUF6266 family protein n=1 Tax=Pedobacter sp. UBA4863 TaxID=1947060 RepID=UPI0025F02A9D|nr:DUF6266 family protein [Pedobacter sp. UBA4863]